MRGLDPRIQNRERHCVWMAGSSPAMTPRNTQTALNSRRSGLRNVVEGIHFKSLSTRS